MDLENVSGDLGFHMGSLNPFIEDTQVGETSDI